MATRLRANSMKYEIPRSCRVAAAGTSCSPTPPATPPRVHAGGAGAWFSRNRQEVQDLQEPPRKARLRGLCPAPATTPTAAAGWKTSRCGLKQRHRQEVRPGGPISIVAFSMGGIVSRQYLQHLGGAARCENFITISSPHHGTALGWVYPTLGAAQMRPGQPVSGGLEALGGSPRENAGRVLAHADGSGHRAAEEFHLGSGGEPRISGHPPSADARVPQGARGRRAAAFEMT